MGLKELLDVTAAGPVSEQAARAALERGQALLDEGDRDGAATAWREAALVPQTQLTAHNLIEAHRLLGAFSLWTGVEASIDPQDDVYRFYCGHGTWSSPMRDYLADGWRTLSELLLLLERGGQTLTEFGSVLEFASGHGRFTRHLVKAVGAGRVTVSDVVPGAVAFSTAQFGAQGFVSTLDPAQLAWPRRYGLVFVLSLFSHLPRATWWPWLERVWEAVEPGGTLVFTTHGAFAAQRAGVQTDGEGFYFHAESESQAIDAQAYGTTYTTREFVLARVAELSLQPARVDFEPAWFWAHQDAIVLRKS